MEAEKSALEHAIDAYYLWLVADPNKPPNIALIAREHGVIQSTLQRRVKNGKIGHDIAHVSQQALTPAEEHTLVDYIRRMAHLGLPIDLTFAREIANQIRLNRVMLQPTVDRVVLRPLGRNWLDKFRKRWPIIKSVFTRNMEAARIDGATPEALQVWFNQVKEKIDTHGYDPSRIFNMDETGHAIGATLSQRVLAIHERPQSTPASLKQAGHRKRSHSSQGSKAILKTGPRQELVTTIECIGADGSLLPPMVIFKSESTFFSGWLPNELYDTLTGWQWATSPSGWTSDKIAVEWLDKIFIPLTQPLDPVERRLLIVDGHGSHVTPEFIAKCMRNAIDLMVLPAHTSHITQPLDVGPFAPLKIAMSNQALRANRYDPGRVQKVDFVRHLVQARQIGMTGENIRSGWRSSGLWPFAPMSVIRRVETPVTPSQDDRQVIPTPIGTAESLADETAAFMTLYEHLMRTPIKNRVQELSVLAEKLQSRNLLLELEIQQFQTRETQRKTARPGRTVSYFGTHSISTQEVYEKAVELMAASSRRKKKSKDPMVPIDSEPSAEEALFWLESYAENCMHEDGS